MSEPEAVQPDETGPDGRPVVFLADEGEAETEALQAGLEREVVVLDPMRLDGEALTRISEAAVVIVPWDLGGQAGLDVVEALRSDEGQHDVPILMSSEAPTRAAVQLALRAGASGFLFEPVEAEEVRPHLPEPSTAAADPS